MKYIISFVSLRTSHLIIKKILVITLKVYNLYDGVLEVYPVHNLFSTGIVICGFAFSGNGNSRICKVCGEIYLMSLLLRQTNQLVHEATSSPRTAESSMLTETLNPSTAADIRKKIRRLEYASLSKCISE